MPHENHKYAFDKINTQEEVEHFFQTVFPDFYKLMPGIADVWEDHPLSSLAIIRCYPWTAGKVALMGDAAHATVPFYGQGMNAGFEDCSVMWDLMNKYNEDWPKVFEEYQKIRKPDGDGVQDLSLHNYYVMRDYVADPEFLLQKKFERRIEQLYPDKYIPLYSQVSFTSIRYSTAHRNGMNQDRFMKDVLQKHDVKAMFENNTVDDLIHSLIDDIQKIHRI